MQVSIIIPIYKAEKYLKRCLDSVLSQTYKDLEIILIDDGSPDCCPLICDDYKMKDGRIKVLHSENNGQGVARNKGIALATGKYIFFVDADDTLVDNAIERLLLIAETGSYDIVSAQLFRVDKKIKIPSNTYGSGEIDRNGCKDYKKRYNLYKTTSNFGYACGKLYRSSFIKKHNIRFAIEKKVFMEDCLFNLKAFSYNPKYYILNEPLYYYYIYNTSTSNRNEDVTDRALKMLSNYHVFLRAENKYEHNIDLFVPLAIRVFCWSIIKKILSHGLSESGIYKTVKTFATNDVIINLVFHRETFKVLYELPRFLEIVFYCICIFLLRLKLYMMISIMFIGVYPIAKIYINKTLKK